MTVSIVACGPSAKDWGKTKFDLSIGCNDAFKFGYPLDQLVVVNFPSKFDKIRLETITRTKAEIFTHTSAWKHHFPKAYVIRLSPFVKWIRPGLIYHSKTSPLVAVSLAYKQGAKNIVLYGVDFTSHKVYRAGTKSGDNEIKVYLKFFDQLKSLSVNVWLGAKRTAFDELLPLYEPKEVFV